MTDYKDRVSGWANDIDWSKAPEGFPIWIEDLNPGKGFDCSGWHRDDGDRYTDEDGKYWTKSEEGIYRVHSPAPQWNGEGLPPVGTVCEFKEHARDSWVECTIIGEFRGRIICGCNQTGAVGYIELGELRPIKTPAQIAAEEREAAIEEIEDIIAGFSYRKLAELIYDAGYRKGYDK